MGGGGVVQVGALFDQIPGGVQAKAIDADLVQPEAGDQAHLRRDLGVGEVEIGHAAPKDAIVIAGGGGVPGGAHGAEDARIGGAPEVAIATGLALALDR